jgi:hypothetical protein
MIAKATPFEVVKRVNKRLAKASVKTGAQLKCIYFLSCVENVFFDTFRILFWGCVWAPWIRRFCISLIVEARLSPVVSGWRSNPRTVGCGENILI